MTSDTPKLNRLSETQAEQMRAELAAAAAGTQKQWAETRNRYAAQSAILEFPSGELLNDTLSLAFAFSRDVLTLGLPITERDNFAAQGLEGKVRASVTLLQAILWWADLPRFRRNLYVEVSRG